MGEKMGRLSAVLSFLSCLALSAPLAFAAGPQRLQMDPKEAEAANEALLQAEAELLQKLDKATPAPTPAVKKQSKPQAKSEPKASLAAPAEKKVEQRAVAASQDKTRQQAAEQTNTAKAAGPAKTAGKDEKPALKTAAAPKGASASLNLQRENAVLRTELAQKEEQIKTLISRLRQMRDSLMVAETEVERLNGIIEKSDQRASARNSYPTGYNAVPAREPERDPLLSHEQRQKASDDMPIATVIVDKANLRAGPGPENSPIMSIGKGTRLAIETRSGSWFRVVAPNGERAWISEDVIAFGRNAVSSPSRTVQVKPYDPNVEEQAMQLLRRAAR